MQSRESSTMMQWASARPAGQLIAHSRVEVESTDKPEAQP